MDDDIVYSGKERRQTVSVHKCEFHSEHVYILSELTKQLRDMAKETERRRELLDDRMDKTTSGLWTEIRTKLSAKVALTFLIAFTLAYVGGVLAVYRGVQANKVALIQGLGSIEIKVNDLNNGIYNLRRDIEYYHEQNGDKKITK